jgi:hypothetical protein
VSFCPFLSHSKSFFICLSFCISVFCLLAFTYPIFYVFLSLCLSLYLSSCLSFTLSLTPSVFLCFSVSLLIFLSVYLCVFYLSHSICFSIFFFSFLTYFFLFLSFPLHSHYSAKTVKPLTKQSQLVTVEKLKQKVFKSLKYFFLQVLQLTIQSARSPTRCQCYKTFSSFILECLSLTTFLSIVWYLWKRLYLQNFIFCVTYKFICKPSKLFICNLQMGPENYLFVTYKWAQ